MLKEILGKQFLCVIAAMYGTCNGGVADPRASVLCIPVVYFPFVSDTW